VTTETSTHRKTPTASPVVTGLRTLVMAALFALGAGSAFAQETWSAQGMLESTDPTYHRPVLSQGQCSLSSIGTDVHFDVHELILFDNDPPPTNLSANLCAGTDFDTVLYFYQRTDGSAGAFSPTAPCDNLIRDNDDYCGQQSAITSNALVPGHLTMVVSSWANGTTGSYLLSASSTDASLDFFIFYDGFEPDDRRWSEVVQ